MTDDILLEVKNLKTYFELDEGTLKAVDDLSFTIYKNRVLGVVGESGCGKSVTAQSIMQIVPRPGTVSGEILWHSISGEVVDIGSLDPESESMRQIRGNEIAMIFQEPMTAFSPVHTIGNQLTEAYAVHDKGNKSEARARALELLNDVGIPAPARRIDEYTFQLSGGMRQRAMIAMAMMNNPQLLIADEPTTALDVTIQAQILRLMKRLKHEFGMAIMFITHDLGVIANMADDVAVMYRGKLVEFGTVRQVLKAPKHPYTKALLRSIPNFSANRERLKAISGTVGIPLNPPNECPYNNRCEFVTAECFTAMPEITRFADGHSVACYRYTDDEEVNLE